VTVEAASSIIIPDGPATMHGDGAPEIDLDHCKLL
jgi:hypothetical protein